MERADDRLSLLCHASADTVVPTALSSTAVLSARVTNAYLGLSAQCFLLLDSLPMHEHEEWTYSTFVSYRQDLYSPYGGSTLPCKVFSVLLV